MRNNLLLLTAFILLTSCSGGKNASDAYGNFESVETIISSEVQGTLLYFGAEEGMKIEKEAILGVVDTIPLCLKKDQVMAQKKAGLARLEGIQAQTLTLLEQKKNLLIEKERVKRLLTDSAVPEKQLDDIAGSLRVLESQINSVNIQKNAVLAELEGINTQRKQIDDQINRSIIRNPFSGTVLEKYVEQYELVSPGKPLYKIAAMDTLVMRAYISGNDLAALKIGQEVEVIIDDQSGKPLKGQVQWISSEAEFTPKIIQTKKERVNLVYAVKIKVPNDGRLKIGMPGEINFMKR